MPPATSVPFVALLQEYQPLVWRVCRLYSQDADDQADLYQEIVLQLWRAWPRYVPGAAKASTWLYRVALNVAISDLRYRSRRPLPMRLGEAGVPDLPLTPAAGPDAEDLAQLYRAIEQLSDVDKGFVLLYLEDRPYEEMAEILGITQNNVRVKMHRVQDKLRILLTSNPTA